MRMFETALGRPAFQAGLKAFLGAHAGGAATCEDLAAAMAAAGPGGQDAAAAAAAAAAAGAAAAAEAEPAEGAGWDARLMLRWYDQAGTPTVEAAGEWNANARTYTLRLSQRTEPTHGQPHKRPVPVPVAAGLLGRASGRQLPLRLAEGALAPASMAAAAAAGGGGGRGGGEAPTELVLLLTASKQTWVFSGVHEEPVPSLLRRCSAPVVLSVRGRRDADLALLAAADPDPYARWDACQELATRALLKVYRAAAAKAKPPASGGGGSRGRGGKGGGGGKGGSGKANSKAASGSGGDGSAPALLPAAAAAAADTAAKAVGPLAAALRPLLADPVGGAEFGAWAFFLPGDLEVYLREEEPVDPGVLQAAREALEAALAAALRAELAAAVAALDAALADGGSGGGGGGGGEAQQQAQQGQQAGGYAYTAEGAARRSLRHACLYLLAALRQPGTAADLQARLAAATNLTDAYGAAEALDRFGGPARAAGLAALHDAWGCTAPGLHAWMALVAGGEEPGNLAAAAALAAHPRFQQGRPAAVESLYHAFAGGRGAARQRTRHGRSSPSLGAACSGESSWAAPRLGQRARQVSRAPNPSRPAAVHTTRPPARSHQRQLPPPRRLRVPLHCRRGAAAGRHQPAAGRGRGRLPGGLAGGGAAARGAHARAAAAPGRHRGPVGAGAGGAAAREAGAVGGAAAVLTRASDAC